LKENGTMSRRTIFLFIFLLNGIVILPGQNMNNKRMGKVLEALADSISGADGFWEFYLDGRVMLGLTDESHNRMRIMSPITTSPKISPEELQACMEANFHTALDVKYAIADGILWSVYIHPLAELSKEQLQDAVKQVYQAAETFGSTYSSTDLAFPKRDATPGSDRPPTINNEKKT
jgi:hypothetical protein